MKPNRFHFAFPLFLVALSLPQVAFGWGSGHEDVMRAIIPRLPAPLRASFTPEIVADAVKHASHYPDSGEPFLEKDIGVAAMARLAEARIKSRYELHSERGAAMCFIMLVDALREKHPAHTAHWIATLSHVISDMSACNHDPIVHTATYAWADWNLKMPGGADYAVLKPLLDLSGSAGDTAGGAAAFDAAIEKQLLRDDQRDAHRALAEVMLYGQEGAAYCSVRGVSVLEGAAGWVDRKDAGARQKLWQNIGELGAWAVVRTLRDVEVAMRLAQADAPLAITPEIEATHQLDVARIIRDRHLKDEALFAPILREWKPGQSPAVGIVLEPSWAMNGAMFGFASRVPSVAIARSLQRSGRSYASFDVRRLIADGFPSPEQVPQMIIVASSFRSYHTLNAEVLDQKLADYLERGGRVLWIMGNARPAPKSLSAFNPVMQRKDAKDRLPVTDEQFLDSSVELIGSGLPALEIAHPAKTNAGWHNPYCAWTYDLKERQDLRPLVALKTSGQSQTVGAITADSRIACIPIYALTPYLFEGSDTIPSAHEPALDPSTERLLTALLDRIR